MLRLTACFLLLDVAATAPTTTTTTAVEVSNLLVGNQYICEDVRVTYQEAADFCSEGEQRLCTQGELRAGAGATTGCDLDYRLIWTSDSCTNSDGSQGHRVELGAGRTANEFETFSCQPDRAAFPVRCCNGPVAVPPPPPTPAPTEAEDCLVHTCSNDCGCAGVTAGRTCSSDCGWSSKHGKCKLGAHTRLDELGLGMCASKSPSANPSRSPSTAPNTPGPTTSPSMAPTVSPPPLSTLLTNAQVLQCDSQLLVNTELGHDILDRVVPVVGTSSEGLAGGREMLFNFPTLEFPTKYTINTCDSAFNSVLRVLEVTSTGELVEVVADTDGGQAAVASGECFMSPEAQQNGGAFLEAFLLPSKRYILSVKGDTQRDQGHSVLTIECATMTSGLDASVLESQPIRTCNGTESPRPFADAYIAHFASDPFAVFTYSADFVERGYQYRITPDHDYNMVRFTYDTTVGTWTKPSQALSYSSLFIAVIPAYRYENGRVIFANLDPFDFGARCDTASPTEMPTGSPSQVPTSVPSNSPTQSPTTAASYCAQFTCGALCALDQHTANCGWSTKLNMCIPNARTSVREYQKGDCGAVCHEIECGNYCRGACGWSTLHNRCQPGAFTKTSERTLGRC